MMKIMSCHFLVLWCAYILQLHHSHLHHSMSISHTYHRPSEISWCFMLFPFPLCNNALAFYIVYSFQQIIKRLTLFCCLSVSVFPSFTLHVSCWRLSNIIISSILLSWLNLRGGNGIKGISLICCGLFFSLPKIQNTQRPWSHHHTLSFSTTFPITPPTKPTWFLFISFLSLFSIFPTDIL